MTNVISFRRQIEGMDCASCAIKIENAMKRLPGVSDIEVSYGSGMLQLKLDEDRSSGVDIEKSIRSLGFELRAEKKAHHIHSHDDDDDHAVWWQTRKAKLAGFSALLALLAFAGSMLWPNAGLYLLSAAALISVSPFVKRAYAAALQGSPFTIETLMSVATIGAIFIGEAEEAVIVVLLFAIGELLENVAAGRARSGIQQLIALIPRTAQRENADGSIEEVAVAELRLQDLVLVRPGDRVPADGDIVEGQSDLDQSPVTGESVPVSKGVGDPVYAGSINTSGMLRVRVTRNTEDNTISRIIQLVERAQDAKAPTARFIDRFAVYYTPFAMLGSLLIAIIPPLFFGLEWETWIYRALATLLIACPCALVISTPAAIASGLAVGARRGLLIKGGAALETLGHVTTVAFDKTGTLTIGKPVVTDVIALDGDDETVLGMAAAVETGASHPLGVAIVEAANQKGLKLAKAYGAEAIAGKAVRARLKDGFVAVGSPRYAEQTGVLSSPVQEQIIGLELEGKTVVTVIAGNSLKGLIALRDSLREDSQEAIAQLKKQGVNSLILTGDNQYAAKAVASLLGTKVQSELLPEAKLTAIEDLKRTGTIAMVGDGINDAPALAAAHVGIALGGGTDVALETADAAILKDRVTGVSELIMLSRATLANIHQNVAIALGLKLIFLATTLLGITSLWMAILADTGATVLVTSNALRLLGWKRKG